jgi:type VI secretion system protein ImpE
MLAEQMLRDGNLQGALSDLQELIRKKPEDSAYRIFLFQLLSVLGQWDRALNQLDIVSNLDKSAWPMVNTYRAVIQCEMLRSDVFDGKSKPLIFGEPPQWMAWLIESVRLTGEGKYEEAVSLRDQAFNQAPETPGLINEKPFQWLADAESRLGPVLEIYLNGSYYWTPFQQIQMINITPPTDLRDLIWLPAEFIWTNGGQAFGLIPTRYSGSDVSQDAGIQLARKTEWIEVADGVFQGVGQRMLTTDQDDYPLLDIRKLAMNSTDTGQNA